MTSPETKKASLCSPCRFCEPRKTRRKRRHACTGREHGRLLLSSFGVVDVQQTFVRRGTWIEVGIHGAVVLRIVAQLRPDLIDFPRWVTLQQSCNGSCHGGRRERRSAAEDSGRTIGAVAGEVRRLDVPP